MAVPVQLRQARDILLDIEGTITPLAFVDEVLFPWARRHVREFLRRRYEELEVHADIEGLRRLREADSAQGKGPPVWSEASADARIASAVRYIEWLMDRDSKATALKSLQGKIWEEGYRSGQLRAETYPDVLPALKRWARQKRNICIFSSGSVLAQELLFANTAAGDVTPFLRAYFDTTTGAKTHPESYQRIAAALAVAPEDVVFVSDVAAELDAARLVGMQTALCVRHENRAAPEGSAGRHPVIRSFDEIFPSGQLRSPSKSMR